MPDMRPVNCGVPLPVLRRERPADAGAVNALLETLDRAPGAWLGCDVEADGLFVRASMGLSAPALAFVLDGPLLQVRALSALGRRLLPHVARLAAFEVGVDVLRANLPGGDGTTHTVLGVLRGFLALFDARMPELGLFGAWSFDYFRLAPGQRLPDDGRRRLVLFFAERILVDDTQGTRWVEFEFPTLNGRETGGTFAPLRTAAMIEPARASNPGAHARRVAKGVERLRSGELAALVLSQNLVREITVPPSVAFGLLRAHNPYPAMFMLNLGGEHLFGASPDLQVRADAQWVESAPVCGTLRRGAEPVEDAAQSATLLGSPKEAASLSACADSDLNDKAQVAVPGSAELVSHRRLHFFNTIIHTVAHTRARRRGVVDAFDILLAHATPATVTGIPKMEAVQAIEALESGWRHWYGGAVARVGTDGSLEAYTVLRAARVIGSMAEVRVGGNLLVDSDPTLEEAETELKAQTLFRVVSGESPRVPSGRRIPAWKTRVQVRVIDLGDPWLARSLDLMARAGLEESAGSDLQVVLGGFRAAAPGIVRALLPNARATLAIGGAALGLLQDEGAALTAFDVARFARPVDLVPAAVGCLAGQLPGQVGLYSAQGVRAGALPGGWLECACDAQGWVLAAEQATQGRVALLFRPDSALSHPAQTGVRVLRAAIDALAL